MPKAPPEPKKTAAPPEPEALKEDGIPDGAPTHRVWIQPQYGDTLLPADALQEKEPLIMIGGVPYRHVADHPDDGAWVYRSN